jgi:Zn-dependent peptidase ImmA (M78 family)
MKRMDEFTAIMRARALVNKVNPSAIPVSVEAYASEMNARVKYDKTMSSGEDGCSTFFNNKLIIAVNANDRPTRQRFTICHEVAHAVLGLASEHNAASWSYAKRPQNEVICDAFAAELLLPFTLFKPHVEKATVGFRAVESLADLFETSLAATASRFAAVTRAPCAYILSEGGKIRYSARSKALREARAWVPLGAGLPDGSMAARLRAGHDCQGPEETAADLWFSDWQHRGELLEDSRYHSPWDQGLSLIWFEDEDMPAQAVTERRLTFENDGLAELDGVLPWPGRRRRR